MSMRMIFDSFFGDSYNSKRVDQTRGSTMMASGADLRHWDSASRPRSWWAVGALLLILVATQTTRGQVAAPGQEGAEEQGDGLFITVRNPIDTKVVNRVLSSTRRFLDRADHRGLKIVYDFNPDGFASNSTDYGTCRDLAEAILKLQDITTIAFVHNDVTGHTVLPVLACKEIVMSPRAKLGDAMRGQSDPLEEDKLVFYKRVAKGRGRYPAIVLKMVDRDLEVFEGRLRNGDTWYIDKREEAEEIKKGFVLSQREPVLKAGAVKLYDVAEADKYGLREHLLMDTRQAIKEAYQLPTSSLREDPLEGRSPNAWRTVVSGVLNKKMQETLTRRVRRAVGRGANLIILQLECGDGDAEVARDLGDFFRELRDDNGQYPVMTIAYVTREARNTAAFLAFGCTDIVMAKDAKLGDFKGYVEERPSMDKVIGKSLEDLADKQGYPPLLARAMTDPKLIVYLVRSQKGKFTERRLVTGEDWEEDRKGDRKWVQEQLIKPAGQWLSVDAVDAKRLDVARYVYDGEPSGFGRWLEDKYGLETVHDARGDWLDEVAAFLCLPVVSVFLVMIGITGLILELKIPGVGLPGVVAALCFVLYFWAHYEPVRGHLTFLAILLFFLGLVLIGLEIFVIPGFGVTGISGIVLIIVSLGLVTLVKKPETTQEWLDFTATLTTLGLGLGGAVVGAMILAWYLPHIPWANRLVLVPPAEAPALVEEAGPSGEGSLAALLGTMGVAATALRPAGMARFGEAYVDVVTEGNYVAEGARVQVIEIEGNRIVVKEV
jgi:membrane-bound ClpP family serine protease